MHTNNSIQNILMNNKQLTNNTEKYIHSGVYKLSCPDCRKAYVGQTGWFFKQIQRKQNRVQNKQPKLKLR